MVQKKTMHTKILVLGPREVTCPIRTLKGKEYRLHYLVNIVYPIRIDVTAHFPHLYMSHLSIKGIKECN